MFNFGRGKKLFGWGGRVHGFTAIKGSSRRTERSVDKKLIKKQRKKYKNQGYDIYDLG